MAGRDPIGGAEATRDHDLSRREVLARVERVARRALACYGAPPEARVTLINVSENATFRVDGLHPVNGARGADGAGSAVLRVHRLGYHTRAAIESELAWLEALRAGRRGAHPRGAARPRRLPGGDRAGSGRGGCGTASCSSSCPAPSRRRSGWSRASSGRRDHRADAPARPLLAAPAGFTRFHWDYDAALGAVARWGRWQDGAGVDREAHEVLSRLDAVLRERLARYGRGPGRYGLIHADLRLANLLVDDPSRASRDRLRRLRVRLVRLRPCRRAQLHRAPPPGARDDRLLGARLPLGARARPAEDEAEIWTFILFRRLLLVAWIGTHGGVDIARELGAGYTAGTCELAERYLSGALR